MTRMDKYADYRKQILNEGNFLAHIDSESNIIKSYHDKIMDLNPNILINEANDMRGFSPIVPLISINQMDQNIFQKLKDFSNLIDTKKQEQIINDISDFIFSYEHNSIISDDNKSISHNWLIQDKNYSKLVQIDKELKKTQNELIDFEKVSVQKLSKLMETIKNSEKSDLDVDIFKVSNDVVDKSISYKKFYLATIWTLLSLLALIVILIIVEVFLYV